MATSSLAAFDASTGNVTSETTGRKRTLVRFSRRCQTQTSTQSLNGGRVFMVPTNCSSRAANFATKETLQLVDEFQFERVGERVPQGNENGTQSIEFCLLFATCLLIGENNAPVSVLGDHQATRCRQLETAASYRAALLQVSGRPLVATKGIN